MQQALRKCKHHISSGKWRLPSQLHFYMEPQTALAQGDGEGGMEVGACKLFLCSRLLLGGLKTFVVWIVCGLQTFAGYTQSRICPPQHGMTD